MLNKKGFTLIESLFTFSIILFLSLLGLNNNHNITTSSIDLDVNRTVAFIEAIKANSLNYHHSNIIQVYEHELLVENEFINLTLKVNSDLYFNNITEIKFNENGNISRSGHLNLCNDLQCKSIFFSLATGEIYVKQ